MKDTTENIHAKQKRQKQPITSINDDISEGMIVPGI